MKKVLSFLQKVWPYLLFLALLAFAFYLRFYHISWRGMTYDECLTEERSHWTIWHLWRYYITSRAPVNAIIYYIDGHLFSLLCKTDVLREWQIRLPSAVFSLLTIPLFFLLGKLLKDKWNGLLLTAVGAVSFILLTHAREARYYSYVCFFTTWLLVEVVCILKKSPGGKDSLRDYALYALAAIGGMGSHQGFYFLFAFSNVFLCVYAFLPLVLLAWDKRKEFGKLGLKGFADVLAGDFETFYRKFLMLVMPCLVYCYQFFLVTGADKPYTPTGRGNDPLISELSFDVVGGICERLWIGAPFAHIVLYLSIAAFVILLFTKLRLIAVYYFFVKLSTFVLLRLLTQRLTYEQFRDKYIIFVLILDMFVLTAAVSYVTEWLWTLTGWLLTKDKERRKILVSFGRALSIIGFSLLICFDGSAYAESEKLFNEQLEDIRYIFDYLKTAYSPGDVVIYQAEPNSWVHKNCLYEKSLRDYARNWIVNESIQMPFMKKCFTKKGCYVWWMIMYRPQKGFNPYFYDGMRAFGSDVNNKNAMLMCRSATKINNLPDAAYLTVLLYHYTNLKEHPQYEKHLIDEALKGQDLENSVFSNYIAKTISTGRFYSPKTKDLLADPNLEFFGYRMVNDWYNTLKNDPISFRTVLTTPLERKTQAYLKACVGKDPEAEREARYELIELPRGWWLYDRIYRFTREEFQRPYITPEELESYLSLEEIYKNRVRFDAAYLTLNPDMAKDWNKLLKRARNDYNEKKNGKKLQNNP
jgi:hypothetical protein